MRKGISDTIASMGTRAQVNGIGSMFQVFFTERPVTDYHSAKSSSTIEYQRYFRSLLASRTFIPPSQFETCFLSTVHTDDQVKEMIDATGIALKAALR